MQVLSAPERDQITHLLRSAGVVYALVFGSAAKGELRPDSDLDIAVAAKDRLSSAQRCDLIAKLSAAVRRPIDLIDLKTARGLVFARALQGEELFCDSVRAKGEAFYRRVSIVEEDLAFAERSFRMAQTRMFR